jgi:hypothetical protein
VHISLPAPGVSCSREWVPALKSQGNSWGRFRENKMWNWVLDFSLTKHKPQRKLQGSSQGEETKLSIHFSRSCSQGQMCNNGRALRGLLGSYAAAAAVINAWWSGAFLKRGMSRPTQSQHCCGAVLTAPQIWVMNHPECGTLGLRG